MIKKYENNGHLIYFGDALEVLPQIATESAHLIFVDPPYNIGKKFGDFHDKWKSDEEYAEWAYRWIDECIRILRKDGTMYIMTSTQAMPYFDLYVREKMTIMSRLIWSYDSSGVQAKRHYGSMYEPILFCVRDVNNYTFNADDILVEARTGAVRKLIDYRKPIPTPYNHKKVPGNVWDIPRVRYRMSEYEDHPSQKPEALMQRIIQASSNIGDIVFDPFSGTFTTAAVAKKLGRNSISIENQEKYLKVGLRRVLEFDELDSEKLMPLAKPYIRKNGNGMRIKEFSGDLFDAESDS